MNDKRAMLRHFLAALAYRTQKALRGMPNGFENFHAGPQVRTPHELICHMTSVLGYARTFFVGGKFALPPATDWNKNVAGLHEMLEDLARHLSSNASMAEMTEERMLQGPFADAMTHAGQLAMLRRLAGSPIPPENFIMAAIRDDNLSSDQPAPVSPDARWPEGPHSTKG
jgi:hypothetical protein